MVNLLTPDAYRRSQYDSYIENHVDGVVRAWKEILRPALVCTGLIDSEAIKVADSLIPCHDKSKWGDDEYFPYLEYFYAPDGSDRDPESITPEIDRNFDYAWLCHQKSNAHHWQYWCLLKDSGDIIPMDMDPWSVCEMICDWHSFTLRNPDSTAYKWYYDNKDKMLFSPSTRDLVEELVEFTKNRPLVSK